MSGSAKVTLAWGDGEYEFRLAIGQLRELQDKTGVGPLALATRIANQQWMVDDIRETIRLGLIGGGMKADQALKLVLRYVDPVPLIENVAPAQTIIMAAVIGVPDDPVGKGDAEEATREAPTASPSPPSSARARRSASRRETLTQ